MTIRNISRYPAAYLLLILTVLAVSCSEKEKTIPAVAEIIRFSNLDKAWAVSKGEGVTVAVVDWLFDTGKKASGKYVEQVSMVPGQKVGSGGRPWHGEWMAELVHMAAPEAKIIAIKARPNNGSSEGGEEYGEQAYERFLIEAIRYAADRGAVAVTNSMGPVRHCLELTEAIEYAESKGTIFIDVHPEYTFDDDGNFRFCGRDEYSPLIIHAGIVSVPDHPVDPDPDRDIYVWPYDPDPVFKDGWGYSNAAPIIGGVIALMRSVNQDLSPSDIRGILFSTARYHDGFAVLDGEAAVKEAVAKKNK